MPMPPMVDTAPPHVCAAVVAAAVATRSARSAASRMVRAMAARVARPGAVAIDHARCSAASDMVSTCRATSRAVRTARSVASRATRTARARSGASPTRAGAPSVDCDAGVDDATDATRDHASAAADAASTMRRRPWDAPGNARLAASANARAALAAASAAVRTSVTV